MKIDKNMNNRKIAIFHYTCCKTGAKKRSTSKKERKQDRKRRVKRAMFGLTRCKTHVFDQFHKRRKSVKKTMFRLTCCKIRRSTSQRRPNQGVENSNISFDIMQNMSFSLKDGILFKMKLQKKHMFQ